MAEVVTVALHRQAVNADDTLTLLRRVVLILLHIAVIARHLEDLISDEVLACTIARHDGTDDVLWHSIVVGEELLRILRQAVTTIAKGRIVVMVTNAGI